MIVCLNGKWMDEKKASISIHDHGFLYGDGIYETIRVYNGIPFHLDHHLKRLKNSANGISLSLPWTLKTLEKYVFKTIRLNHHQDAVVRVTISRGPGLYGFDPRSCVTPTLVIVSRPFHSYPLAFFLKGIKVAVVNLTRNDASAQPPSIKATSCLNGVLAKIESLRVKAQEGIFLSKEGFVTEGTVSNIFFVKKGRLCTPSNDGAVLGGVTRGVILSLAQKNKIPCVQGKFKLKDLIGADEIFVSNSTMEVMPVSQLVVMKDKKVFRFSVGKTTKKLMDSFAAVRPSQGK